MKRQNTLLIGLLAGFLPVSSTGNPSAEDEALRALHCEFLGQEMGIYTTPYERFGRPIYEMWRAVRLMVDTGLHAFGWNCDQAIDYMLENTGFTRTNVIAEVDRYITYPGQSTACKHGELKITTTHTNPTSSVADWTTLLSTSLVPNPREATKWCTSID